MVRLNRNTLDEEQLNALFKQLNGTLNRLTKPQANTFLSELLGNEERIMIAKRLAIVVLLLEGKSLYKISKTLKVSPTTAEKLKQRLDTGEMNGLVSILGKNKKEYFSVLKTLDSILHLGGILPHYNGLERYRNTNKLGQ